MEFVVFLCPILRKKNGVERRWEGEEKKKLGMEEKRKKK